MAVGSGLAAHGQGEFVLHFPCTLLCQHCGTIALSVRYHISTEGGVRINKNIHTSSICPFFDRENIPFPDVFPPL